jgi:hypothetical protein
MAGHEDAIRLTLAEPDEVWRSRKARKGFLFLSRQITSLDLRSGEARKWRRVSGDRVAVGCDQNRGAGVENIKVIHDAVGHTLTVWIDDPKKEAVCEETDAEVIVVKDSKGRTSVSNYFVTNQRIRATG